MLIFRQNPCISKRIPGAPFAGYCYLRKRNKHIDEVAKAGNAKADDLRDRKTKLKDLGQIAMELSYRYSNCKQTEIGMIFGVDYSTVSQGRTRLKAKLKSNHKLKKQFNRVKVQIDNLSKSKI
jgi:chromosomal replication initiation ATPase DnaA